MACCVFMAALIGGLAILKSILRVSPRGQGAAQEWRLTHRKDSNE